MRNLFTITVFYLTFLLQSTIRAEVKLPKMVGDNMILQRDTRVTIFGSALRVERVTVTFQFRVYYALPNERGEWFISLPPMPAGGPYEMEIFGKNTIQLKNIMVGEVWLASGQSNMEWKLADQVNNHKAEIAAANYPDIRFVDVKNTIAAHPQRDYSPGGWQLCSPKTAGQFSAVAYFFARELHQLYKVPVGIIQAEWGGTPAEAWVSTATLKQFPEFKEAADKLDRTGGDLEEKQTAYNAGLAAWQKTMAANDRGYAAKKPWYEPRIQDEETWHTMRLPGLWENAGLPGYDGAMWFRKDIEVPKSEAGMPLHLHLGKVDDEDIAWFNGTEVGRTSGWDTPRHYIVPGNLVKSGRNVVVVRVNDTGGGGGLHGEPADLRLESQFFKATLAGEWHCRTAVDISTMPKPPAELRDQNSPGVLYNGMIAAVVPYTIRGVIWYQGESNASRAYQYRNLFPALIRDWRTAWAQPEPFPFLFVQLANFKAPQPQPGESEWAELREAQTFALNEPKTAMAVAIDIGDANDIHPRNKLDVGRRLAVAARGAAYEDTLLKAYSGPMYRSMTLEGNKVRLLFDHTADGLLARKGVPKGFAIAGEDRKFVWAHARIEGNSVVVWSAAVPKPTAVRYGWADNPECNLYNTEGLPASPFRTDQWPGVTIGTASVK